MNWRRLLKTTAAATLLGATMAVGSACADTYGRVYVRVGPPPPVYEVRAYAPGPGYVWIEGYHRWDGNGYAWVAGRWARPPRAHAAWVPGHWNRDSRGWFFIDGHWR